MLPPGDGDSSVHTRLLAKMPYGLEVTVQKIECRNHLKRNFCTKLYELAKRTKAGYPPDLRLALKNNVIRLRTAVTTASRRRKEQDCTANARLGDLKKDLLNAPYHVFGSHERCHERAFNCPGPQDGEVNLVPAMKECGLLREVTSTIVWCLVIHAPSLLMDCSNNPAEHYNSYVNKFLGGRRVNYALRGSYAR
jgi:hypothetical protein